MQCDGTFFCHQGMYQLAVYLRPDGHFDEIIVNITGDPGLGGQFDMLAAMDITDHHPIDDDIGNIHFTLYGTLIAERYHGSAIIIRQDVAFDGTIDMQPPGEPDIADDLRMLAY